VQRIDTNGRGESRPNPEDMESRDTTTGSRSAADFEAEIGRRPRRRWPWIVLGAIVFAAIAVGLMTRSATEPVDDAVADVVNTAESVTTDLVEIETFDGTLGRVAADPIQTLNSGVLTFVASAGDVVDNGEVLYRVEGDPVVLLTGEFPPYRDLGFASGATGVIAGVNGTITAMPEVGTVVDQGDVVFEIDGQPVVALYGDTPAYRTMADLSDDMTGTDVAQLETALAALGFTGFTVDDEYTNATENAVEDFQDSIGALDDGIVNLGEVVFIPGPSVVTSVTAVGNQVGASQAAVVLATEPLSPGPDVAQLEASLVALGYGDGLVVDDTFTLETRDAVLAWQADIGADTDGIVNLGEVYFAASALRVNDQLASIGSTVGNGSPVLGITAAEIVVMVDLPADDQDLLDAGEAVIVVLPDNSELSATVDSVATVATFNQQGDAVFEVVISLDDASAAAGLDEAPVDVDVVSDSVSNVLAVPVSALVALSEGGYAVEVLQSDGTTVLKSVEPGFYADGLVEVTETDLTPGMLVVVP
jgi:peptidoglycan hydrolase-like protein with peptidoglycan-binding domain